MTAPTARARERRVARRLEARGLRGLGEALVRLGGTRVGERWVIDCLYAVGAEGAVFLCRDLGGGDRAMHVAKVALHPYHKPFELSFQDVRARRERLRAEARHLEKSASAYMPRFLGLHEVMNPLLDARRGGEFRLTEPVLVMERLPGFDLDYWLARVHGSRVPRTILRRNVDHVAVVVLRALWDLHERGYFYCDLRPGNIRIRGRSEHRVRLMDAGSLVERVDTTGGFPHVPAYLPPDLFWLSQETGPEALVPSLPVQATMAGRTLFEAATGRVPVPGQDVDMALLKCDTVSPEVADTVEGLCTGSFPDVFHALRYLAKRTDRGRSHGGAARRPARSRPAPSPIVASPLPNRPAAVLDAIANRRIATGPVRDLASALAAARAVAPPTAAAPRVASHAAVAATEAKARAHDRARFAPPRPVIVNVTQPPIVRRVAPVRRDDAILPRTLPRRSFWRRFLDALLRR
jgi:serine/threonine protein kinase